MKHFAAFVVVLASAVAAPAFAGSDHAQHGASSAEASAPMEMVSGQVKKVDTARGRVTLAHGPLSNLGMPAMTMSFKVANASWIKQMKVGDKVRFMADRVDGVFTIVHFEPAK